VVSKQDDPGSQRARGTQLPAKVISVTLSVILLSAFLILLWWTKNGNVGWLDAKIGDPPVLAN
jgi:hypothetical protein